MIMRTLNLLTLAGGLTAALVSGCGGKVIVDGMGNEGGQGGQGSSNSSVSDGVGGASTCGSFPAPNGTLNLCGTTDTGAGGPDFCIPLYCDMEGNIYEAQCTGTNCSCSVTSIKGIPGPTCTCTIPSGCLTATPCCPFIH